MGIEGMDDLKRLRERISGLRIGIISKDFSFIHDLLVIARDKGITSVVIIGQDDTPERLDCILVDQGSSPEEISGITNSHTVISLESADASMERAICSCLDRLRPEHLVVGIDPGKRPGMAFLADGRLISTFRTNSDLQIISRLKMMVEACVPGKILVRIGNGAPKSRDRIISRLKDLDMDIRMEMVDERMTSRTRKFRDETAAIMIAWTTGSPI